MPTHHSQPSRRRLGRLVVLVAALAATSATSFGASPAAAAAPQGESLSAKAGIQAAAVVAHGPRSQKVVALTFDDGYNPAVCGALVDVLERTQTPATFFPNSVNVVRTPALWRRVAALGFPIGNHTATHPFLPGLTYVGQWNEIWT